MTRADSARSGDAQLLPDAALAVVDVWLRFCSVPPSRRTAPTPTPVATAAASAWRRWDRRLGGPGAGDASTPAGIWARALRQVHHTAIQHASAGCEAILRARR